jgi:hypothetical protein
MYKKAKAANLEKRQGNYGNVKSTCDIAIKEHITRQNNYKLNTVFRLAITASYPINLY